MAASGVQVLVQLGSLPGYSLHYAAQAARMMPEYRTVLITNHRVRQVPAGVQVVHLDSVVTRAEIELLNDSLVRGGFDLSYRRGYWRWVFLRFLTIRNYLTSVDIAGPAVHLECDVASFVTPGIVEGALRAGHERALIPTHDVESACPSIIVARSASELAAAMGVVVDRLGAGRDLTDMRILGQAVAEGLLDTLPTQPSASSQSLTVSRLLPGGRVGDQEQAMVVFDAAAVGQYLFGIDPRNNGGVLVPGYRETRGGVDPGIWTDWHLVSCEDGITRVAMRDGGRLGVLAVIHVHAKTSIPLAQPDSVLWNEWLSVANHVHGPVASVNAVDVARFVAERATLALRIRLRGLLGRKTISSGPDA